MGANHGRNDKIVKYFGGIFAFFSKHRDKILSINIRNKTLSANLIIIKKNIKLKNHLGFRNQEVFFSKNN